MKSINTNAPVTCSRSVNIDANIEKVWAVLTHINEWSNWQPTINKATLNGALEVGATFNWRTAGASIVSTLHTVSPFEEFGWTGKTFGVFAIHNWHLTYTNGICTVLVEESMEGILALLFKKSFEKNLAKGMEFWLKMLKQTSEK